MKQKIIRYFNEGAATYDSSAQLQLIVAKNLASRVKIAPPKKILEIGCGTGLLSQHLISLFPDSSISLTDISPEMTKVCHERFKSHPRINTLCIDVEEIQTEEKFDLIISSMAMHWLENLNLTIQKLIDKLSPLGSLVFAMPGSQSFNEWRTMCKAMNIITAPYLFPDKKELESNFPYLKVETENILFTYDSAYAFLHSLKMLGARASHKNHITIGSGKLRGLFRRFSTHIMMTYEIIYGNYTKS